MCVCLCVCVASRPLKSYFKVNHLCRLHKMLATPHPFAPCLKPPTASTPPPPLTIPPPPPPIHSPGSGQGGSWGCWVPYCFSHSAFLNFYPNSLFPVNSHATKPQQAICWHFWRLSWKVSRKKGWEAECEAEMLFILFIEFRKPPL